MSSAKLNAPKLVKYGPLLSPLEKEIEKQRAKYADLIRLINIPSEMNISRQTHMDLSRHLFSVEEINYLINKPHFDPNDVDIIDEKIGELLPHININHRIDARLYNNVFITSDIHADFRKFFSILKHSGIIISALDTYKEEDLYNPLLLVDFTWNFDNALLIITGDLVDGKRDDTSVNDPRGSFELMLHIFIYNLRIKAIQKNSNVIFTLGNHDCDTINNNGNGLIHYIHESSLVFFNSSYELRKNALIPFYRLSPYIFIILDTPAHRNEIVCVHGGLHFNEKKIDRNELENLQNAINRAGLDVLMDYYRLNHIDNLLYADYEDGGGVVWSRFYALSLDPCTMITEGERNNEYKMIVVGHCPTNNSSSVGIMKTITNNHTNYEHCEKPIETYPELELTYRKKSSEHTSGCIVLRCESDELDGENGVGAPRIALVDTAMSSGFRPALPISLKSSKLSEEDFNNIISTARHRWNFYRGVEILQLLHLPDHVHSKRYYNKINRVLIKPQNQPEIINVYSTHKIEDLTGKLVTKSKYLKYKYKYFKLSMKI